MMKTVFTKDEQAAAIASLVKPAFRWFGALVLRVAFAFKDKSFKAHDAVSAIDKLIEELEA